MRRRLTVALVMAWSVCAAPAAQRSSDAGVLLTRYLRGERALGLSAAFDPKAFLASLADTIDKGLPGPPEAARRAAAAFALEAAAARLDAGDIPSTKALLEWACARVRRHEPADDFDIAWHAAALSLAESWLDPPALEAHVQHVRAQLPGDPLAALAWAVAAEQRASPLFTSRPLPSGPGLTGAEENRARQDAATRRLRDEAIDRLTKAVATPRTTADAHLRIAHLHLLGGDWQAALTALDGIEAQSREGWIVYLARVFRGQALDQLNRPDDASASYREALKVGPGGQSATMGLSTVLFRGGQRAEAEALVQLLLSETDPISDPWWTYWAGSARQWNARLAALRATLQ